MAAAEAGRQASLPPRPHTHLLTSARPDAGTVPNSVIHDVDLWPARRSARECALERAGVGSAERLTDRTDGSALGTVQSVDLVTVVHAGGYVHDAVEERRVGAPATSGPIVFIDAHD